MLTATETFTLSELSFETMEATTPVGVRRAYARLDSGRGDTYVARDSAGAWLVVRVDPAEDPVVLWRDGDPLPRQRARTREGVLLLHPRLVSHLVAFSLGYASPLKASSILLDFINREPNWCEWICACYGGDPAPAVLGAVRSRHTHRGYMASYAAARGIVESARWNGQPASMLASWF